MSGADRLRTAPLDTEHLDADAMLPTRVVELRAAGYPIQVEAIHPTVNDKPDAESSAYLVFEIRTLAKHPEDADAVEDEMILWACHCAHYHYRLAADLEERPTPADALVSEDKHIRRVRRAQGRTVDEEQVTFA